MLPARQTFVITNLADMERRYPQQYLSSVVLSVVSQIRTIVFVAYLSNESGMKIKGIFASQ